MLPYKILQSQLSENYGVANLTNFIWNILKIEEFVWEACSDKGSKPLGRRISEISDRPVKITMKGSSDLSNPRDLRQQLEKQTLKLGFKSTAFCSAVKHKLLKEKNQEDRKITLTHLWPTFEVHIGVLFLFLVGSVSGGGGGLQHVGSYFPKLWSNLHHLTEA